jgi:hypothetical protein
LAPGAASGYPDCFYASLDACQKPQQIPESSVCSKSKFRYVDRNKRAATARKRTLDAIKLAHANAPLNGLLIVASLFTSTAPLYAQREQQNVAKLKADARNLVGIIGSDKTKTPTYCQIADLSEQLIQAVQEKDRKKANAAFIHGCGENL